MPQPPSAPPNVVSRARGLSKVYAMGEIAVHALRDIYLDIYEGEFVVLLGPSGSGKSTLLNILGGLDAPTSGQAMWRDHDLVNADDAELTHYRREHVGFVFQFYNLIPSLTVLENVALVNEIADKPLDPRAALAWAGLLYAGFVSQYLAFFVFNAAMAIGGVSRVGQLMLLQPFVIVALAAPVNGEPIELTTLAYAAAVVATVIVGQRMRVMRG